LFWAAYLAAGPFAVGSESQTEKKVVISGGKTVDEIFCHSADTFFCWKQDSFIH
jgi:hypothetical protein